MKIAVIDDERPSRSELKHQILELLPQAEILEADCGAAALELFGSCSPDLIFLDINLGDIEGTTLATAAQRMLPDAKIIFATAYSEYAAKAFELGVANYILKPFDPERVRIVLEQCMAGIKQQSSPTSLPNRIAINTNRKTVFLDISHIAYIETSGRGCIIHSQGGDFAENQLLGEFEKKLIPHGFFRIHKSYLVNLASITELFPWANNSLALRMQGFESEILPVGRERVKALRQILNIL